MTYGYRDFGERKRKPIPLDTEIPETLRLKKCTDRPVGLQGGFPSFPAESLAHSPGNFFFPAQLSSTREDHDGSHYFL